MKNLILPLVIFCCMSSNALSDQFTQANIEIDRLGSQPGQVFYLNFKEAFTVQCAQGQIYCPVSNENCKNYYSLVLASKLANKKLHTVTYTQDNVSKYCVLDGVGIN